MDRYAGSRLEVDFQNEWTVARVDGAVRITVPDLICILDEDNAEAIGTETIRYGQRVDVISLPAAPILVSTEGLAAVGPRAFGYDLDFVSAHRAAT